MREVLGKIQNRDLSKNFLRFFKTYLTQEDLNEIRKNKKLRGEIIPKRIKELFPEAKKEKLEIVQKLIESSSNLIKHGNYFAHYITLDNYENEIQAYKEKNNLDKLTSLNGFAF